MRHVVEWIEEGRTRPRARVRQLGACRWIDQVHDEARSIAPDYLNRRFAVGRLGAKLRHETGHLPDWVWRSLTSSLAITGAPRHCTIG